MHGLFSRVRYWVEASPLCICANSMLPHCLDFPAASLPSVLCYPTSMADRGAPCHPAPLPTVQLQLWFGPAFGCCPAWSGLCRGWSHTPRHATCNVRASRERKCITHSSVAQAKQQRKIPALPVAAIPSSPYQTNRNAELG